MVHCENCSCELNVFLIESPGKYNWMFLCERCIYDRTYRKKNNNARARMNSLKKFFTVMQLIYNNRLKEIRNINCHTLHKFS